MINTKFPGEAMKLMNFLSTRMSFSRTKRITVTPCIRCGDKVIVPRSFLTGWCSRQS